MAGLTAQLCLLSLPIELRLTIFSCLDAADIVHLRQTCKPMYYTERRFHDAIWRSCLDQACEAGPIFRPSLKLRGEQSTDSANLEYLALRPFRMQSLLERHRNSRSISKPETPLPCHVSEIVNLPILDTVILLPGGKYLLSLAGGGNMSVWDLGTQLDKSPRPQLAANFAFGMDVGWKPQVCTADGPKSESVLILVKDSKGFEHLTPRQLKNISNIFRQTDVLEFYVVYELSFDGPKGWNGGLQLRKVAALPLIHGCRQSPEPEAHKLSQDACTIVIDDVRIVWDFWNASYAVQSTSQDAVLQQSTETCHPDNQSRPGPPIVEPIPEDDVLRIEKDAKITKSGQAVQTHASTHSWGTDARYLSTMCQGKERKSQYLDIRAQHQGTDAYQVTTSLRCTRPAEGQLCHSLSLVLASGLPSSKCFEAHPAASVPLVKFGVGDSPIAWDFCPHSGRLVVAHPARIVVHDYLRPYCDSFP